MLFGLHKMQTVNKQWHGFFLNYVSKNIILHTYIAILWNTYIPHTANKHIHKQQETYANCVLCTMYMCVIHACQTAVIFAQWHRRHVARVWGWGGKSDVQRIWWVNLKETDHVGKLGVGDRITLIVILHKLDWSAWTCVNPVQTGTSDVLLWTG